MKQSIAILLFICISCQMAAKIGVIAWFKANRDYVAKELCENRGKPEKKCAGKCYLKKQLNNIEKEPTRDNQPEGKKHKVENIEFLASNFFSPAATNNINVLLHNDKYVNHYHYTFEDHTFHPPTVLTAIV